MTTMFGHTRSMVASTWYAVNPEFYMTQEGKHIC